MDEGLRKKLSLRGFTPGRKEAMQLLHSLPLAEEEETALVLAALSRMGTYMLDAVASATLAPEVWPGVLRALGRASRDERTRSFLVGQLISDSSRTRREAIVQLGKAGIDQSVEAALLKHFESFDHAAGDALMLAERRALVEALGKVGGAPAKAVLTTESTDAAQLANLRLERSILRDGHRAVIAMNLPVGKRVRFFCRAGLSEIVKEDLLRRVSVMRATDTTPSSPESVDVELLGTLGDCLLARTWTELGFVLHEGEVPSLDKVAALVARAWPLVASLSSGGTPRYRIDWSQGHRRKDTQTLASEITLRLPQGAAWVNDPKESTWEVRLTNKSIVLVPKAMPDTRFAYRSKTIAASSHPTLAAALVSVSCVASTDVVWDPFVGAGTELAERAAAGPYQHMVGSDHDERAVVLANENLRHVEQVSLRCEDALRAWPSRTNLVITNPPMGRRVRTPELAEMLGQFVEHVGNNLPEGGRLVWFCPLPSHVGPRARNAGLHLRRKVSVDMGGFSPELQVWEKSGSAPR